jgi:YidC/Oxa1 family membrane protein insertase
MLSIHPVAITSSLLAHLATAFASIGGAVAAIIVLTLLVRLAVHPLTRAAVRGERARLRLAPRVLELRRRHAGNIGQLSAETSALYKREGISPLAGMLPMLIQAPIFLILYAAFRDANGPLAGAHLFGVPLATHAFATAGPAHVAIYAALFAILAALAWITSRRAAMLMRINAASSAANALPAGAASRSKRGAASTAVAATDSPIVEAMVGRLGRIMPYALLISAAVLPLAAVIYVATTTTWSAVENVALRRGLL